MEKMYTALPFGAREAMCRDIGEIQQTVKSVVCGYTSNATILTKVTTWIETADMRVRPSERENRDAAIVRSLLLEHLIETPDAYSLITDVIQMLRYEYAIYVALCPNKRLRAIILTNYPTDEYAAGLGVTGYRLTHREGYGNG